jgi:hypothetical protein
MIMFNGVDSLDRLQYEASFVGPVFGFVNNVAVPPFSTLGDGYLTIEALRSECPYLP